MNLHRTLALFAVLLVSATLGWVEPQPAPRHATAPLQDSPRLADGRRGVVVDRQGTALLRPATGSRWTPLRQRALLMPGDRIRTLDHGAHALECELAGKTRLILGPATELELLPAGGLRLYRGDLAVQVAEGGKVATVQGPGGGRVQVKGRWVGRAAGRKLSTLAEEPRWLEGYRKSSTAEWVGSLIAQVDGRDVPLSVGYHKVDVVIRDQIALTTVEQSFLNQSNQRLEGVFSFPLPADASISGFGMWIGNELVEADIVEKQRARQIYEDILRRKKDPGLLEWDGGNMFKARVFPIEARSAKRIRLRYTQVLPFAGSTLRYRYALRSELLRKNPLQQLDIKLTVASSRPLRKLGSPTHEVRSELGERAARLEYSARNVTPERDFEAQIELDRSAALTAVSHQRGDDGYFMLMFTPPGQDQAGFRRQLTPEGAPLDVLFVADTSASMDPAARRVQRDFLAATLGLLGSADRFRLMAADVSVHNHSSEPLSVKPASIEGALKFLAARPSLGWTDLDAMWTQVLAQAGPKTLVIYLGDGTNTTGDADPVAQAGRIRARAKGRRLQVHPVSPGAGYEQGVLQAMASCGAGAVRRMDADPAQTAYAILAEAAQPGIEDLQLEIRGLRTARVYPRRLPLGQQQVVLGRYLPTGANQEAVVEIRGRMGGKPQRFTTRLQVQAAVAGNSFIPRLWARRHLDALLEQGKAPQVQEDIVAFSREFGIMTPYTSFLVLEDEADRKRYGVARQMKMQDGEQFFADARDAARQELRRRQLRLARSWRLQLRLRMLAQITEMGRSLQGFQVAHAPAPTHRETGRWSAPATGGGGLRFDRGRSLRRYRGAADRMPEEAAGEVQLAANKADFDGLEFAEQKALAPSASPMVVEEAVRATRGFADSELGYLSSNLRRLPASKRPFDKFVGGRGLFDARQQHQHRHRAQGLAFFGFPGLAAPPSQDRLPLPDWDPKILRLLARVHRAQGVRGDRPISLESTWTGLHPVNGRVTGWRIDRGWWAAGEYWLHSSGRGMRDRLDWHLQGRRGTGDLLFGLGRHRAAKAGDARFAFPLGDGSSTDWARAYRDHLVGIEALAGGLTRVILRAVGEREAHTELDIDPATGLIRARREYLAGRRVLRVVVSQTIQRAGQHWAAEVLHYDAADRLVARRQLRVGSLDEAALAKRKGSARGARRALLLAEARDPSLAEARQALAQGKATALTHLRLCLRPLGQQRYAEALQGLEAALSLMQPSQHPAWMRLRLLAVARRGEDFARQLRAAAQALADAGEMVSPSLRNWFRSLARPVLGVEERWALQQQLRALPVDLAPGKPWAAALAEDQALEHDWAEAALLRQLGRLKESRSRYAAAARRAPHRLQALQLFAHAIVQHEGYRAQFRYLRSELDRRETLAADERAQLYTTATEALWQLRDLAGLHRLTQAWVAEQPARHGALVRWLSAEMFLQRSAAAEGWVAARLRDGKRSTLKERAELAAALSFALGQGWQLRDGRIRGLWQGPLVALMRRGAEGEAALLPVAHQLLAHYRFRNTEGFRRLRQEVLARALAKGGLAELSESRLRFALALIRRGGASLTEAQWLSLTDQLRARFDAETKLVLRRQWADGLLWVFDRRGRAEPAMAFLRSWIEKTPEERRAPLRRKLFDRLLARPWTAAMEAEVLALLPQLRVGVQGDFAIRRAAYQAVRRLTVALEKARSKALLGDPAVLEKLPRSEARQRRREAARKARQELAKSLAAAAGGEGPEARYLGLESLSLRARDAAAADLPALFAAARSALLALPEGGEADADSGHRLIRERYALVLAFLSIQKGADPGLGKAALELFARMQRSQAESLDWRFQSFRLRLVLGPVDGLHELLRGFLAADGAELRWLRVLAYLHAEQGAFAAAIPAMWQVDAGEQCDAQEMLQLADWCLLAEDAAGRRRAQARRWELSSSYQLRQHIDRLRQKVKRPGGSAAGVLSEDDIAGVAALLRKSSRPRNESWRVSDLYKSSKDHRVLKCLAEAVIGHSPGRVYEFVAGAGSLIGNVYEEATCLQLREAVQERLAEARTATDRRALLLLRMQIERRAAKVENARRLRTDEALHTLRKVAEFESFVAGERRALAATLSALGRLPEAGYGAEQRRQLRLLATQAQGSAVDQLAIHQHWAETCWRYGRHAEAMDILSAGLDARRAAAGGHLPRSAQRSATVYLNYMRNRGRFRAAEAWILAETARQQDRQARDWYAGQLLTLYTDCLSKGGEVALGRGRGLLQTVTRQVLSGLAEHDYGRFRRDLGALRGMYIAAHKAAVPGVRVELRALLREAFPGLLRKHVLDQSRALDEMAGTVNAVLGGREALQFLITWMEKEPAFLRGLRREYWRRIGSDLARLRRDNGIGGPWAARLAKLVLAEMRIDLAQGAWRYSQIFYQNNRYFWPAQAAAFAQVARQQLQASPDDSRLVGFASQYLWRGLNERDAAVAALRELDKRRRLSASLRWRLTGWLRELHMFRDAAAQLAILREEHPQALSYRLAEAEVFCDLDRRDEARQLLVAAVDELKKRRSWHEGQMAQVAGSAKVCRFWPETETWYREAVRTHERNKRRGWSSRRTRDRYYQAIAKACSRQGKLKQAVDAASAAVVVWGTDLRHRKEAVQRLREVLHAAEDLRGFCKDWDTEVARTGQDAPLLRKQLGHVLMARGQLDAAIAQFRAGLELQVTDADLHKSLIRALRRRGDRDGERRALGAAIAAMPRELDFYSQLGRRLDGHEAERAYTSLVEIDPHQAEGHRLLAKLRSGQGRHRDALLQWQQVVRVRRFDPAGHVSLAKAQLAVEDRVAARKTLQHVLSADWQGQGKAARQEAAVLLRSM